MYPEWVNGLAEAQQWAPITAVDRDREADTATTLSTNDTGITPTSPTEAQRINNAVTQAISAVRRGTDPTVAAETAAKDHSVYYCIAEIVKRVN